MCAQCGEEQKDVLNVTIGGAACLNFTVAVPDIPGQPLEIICVSPPGVGRELSVEVLTRGGKTSAVNGLFSYNAPVVKTIDPVLVLTGDISYNFTIDGEGMGRGRGDLDWVEVGGRRCQAVEWVSPFRLRCVGAAAPWYSNFVVVSVAGQRSRNVGLLSLVTEPQVSAVVSGAPDGINSVDGGYRVNASGRGFGVTEGDVVRVMFGDIEAAAFRWISDQLVEAEVPAGVGVDVDLVVERRDGLVSLGGLFSYALPAVSGCSPDYSLPGSQQMSITLLGSNLGSKQSDVITVFVGEVQCDAVTLVSSSRLVCDLPAVGLWVSSTVQLITSYTAPLFFDDVFEGF